MNILVISQYWAPENGVPQRRWTWLTEFLERAGHNVTVIAPPPHYNQDMSIEDWLRDSSFCSTVEQQSGNTAETIVRTGFFPSGRSLTRRIVNQAAVAGAGLWVVFRRPGPLKDFNPDLVIGTVPALPTAVVTYLASRRFKAPYIVDLRDAWPDLIRESERWNSSMGKPSLRERFLRHGPLQTLGWITTRSLNFSLRRANGILVTASRLRESLKVRYPNASGKPSKRIALVRNVFPIQVQGFKKEVHSVERVELRVLYAGTIGRAQNLANAVHAAKLAKDRGINVRLRFVGTGAACQELAKLARKNQVEAEFSSRIEPENLTEHYRWADTALVHLTDWKPLENAVPSKTYELMSIGLHISAVVSGEAAELVELHQAGHTVPPESPAELARMWETLLEDPKLLEVSANGAMWVEKQRTIASPRELLRLIESFDNRNATKANS